MKRNVDLAEISDGKLYMSGDLVKADTHGCAGCFDCCRGMGESVILDPYDCLMLEKKLGQSFEQLLNGKLELHVVDGIILPNLSMSGADETCAFLDGQGRCSIHDARPGVCRLFPLGRYYEGRSFMYFLQTQECAMMTRSKIKVKKWLGIPDLQRYEQYICDWHYFLEDAEYMAGRNEAIRKQINMYILQSFFIKEWNDGQSFFEQFYQRLSEAKKTIGIA